MGSRAFPRAPATVGDPGIRRYGVPQLVVAAAGAPVELGAYAVVLAEADYHRRPEPRDTGRVLGYALLDNLGSRQLASLCCLPGLVDVLRGRRRYVQPTRRGFAADDTDAIPVTPSNRI